MFEGKVKSIHLRKKLKENVWASFYEANNKYRETLAT